jgi:hypothetical protein
MGRTVGLKGRDRGGIAAVVAACAALAWPATTEAQPPASNGVGVPDREAQRKELYREALKSGEAGRWEEAKERLRAVLAIRSSPKVLFSLAQTEEHLGQIASAQSDYLRALEGATFEGKQEVVQAARQAERALSSRVPHVRAVLGPPPGKPGSEVSGVGATLDDRPVTLGTAVAVDPGEHKLIVSAPGMRPAVVTVKVNEGQELDLSVALEPERPSPTAAGPPLLPPPQQARARMPEPTNLPARPETPSDSGSSLRTVGLVTTGVGILALGVGAAFGVEAIRKHDKAAKACPDATCASADDATLWHDAVTSGNVSTLAFVVGGVGVAAGALVWLAAPRSSPDAARVGLGPGLVQLRGAW